MSPQRGIFAVPSTSEQAAQGITVHCGDIDERQPVEAYNWVSTV